MSLFEAEGRQEVLLQEAVFPELVEVLREGVAAFRRGYQGCAEAGDELQQDRQRGRINVVDVVHQQDQLGPCRLSVPPVPPSSNWWCVQVVRWPQSTGKGPENVEARRYRLVRLSSIKGSQRPELKGFEFRLSGEGADIHGVGEAGFDGEQKVALSGSPFPHHHDATGGGRRNGGKDEFEQLRPVREC
ncbi:hypothetical protein D3C73_994160 [compost metagenome]